MRRLLNAVSVVLILAISVPPQLLSATTFEEATMFSTPVFEGQWEWSGDAQDKDAYINMSVISVSRWDECKDNLQVAFDMTPALALTNAVKATVIEQQQYMNALTAGLSIALAGNKAPSGWLSNYFGGYSSLKAPSQSPRPPLPAALFGLAGDQLGAEPPVDSIMKYNLAAALYQEVQMINRSVKDAVKRTGFTPYIVRMQINVMQSSTNQPHDVYSALSFFPAKASKEDGRSSTDDTRPCPQVVPLFVADNVEGAMQSLTEERIRQMSLDIMAMLNGIGIGGNFQSASDKLDGIKGRRMNNLMSVARVSDNTLGVKISAYQVGNKDAYATANWNHYVTLLILVPEGAEGIRVFSRSELYDSKTGKMHAGRSSDTLRKMDNEVLNDYGLDADDDFYHELLGKLIAYAQENDWVGYCETIKNPDGFLNEYLDRQEIYCRDKRRELYSKYKNGIQNSGVAKMHDNLWLSLMFMEAGGKYSQTYFELPKRGTPVLPDTQYATAKDDNEGSTCVSLSGGKNLRKGDITASLDLDGKVEFVANKVEVQDGSNPSFTFPSLKYWGVDLSGKSLELALSCNAGGNSGSQQCKVYHVLYREKPQKDADKPGFDIELNGSVSSERRKGSLKLTVLKNDCNSKEVSIAVSGADIDTADKGIVSFPENKFKWEDRSNRFIVKLDKKEVERVTLVIQLVNIDEESGEVTLQAGEVKGKSLPAKRIRVVKMEAGKVSSKNYQ